MAYKKSIAVCLFTFVAVFGVFAQEVLSDATKFTKSEDWKSAYTFLKQNISTITDKAQLGQAYCDLSSYTMEFADDLERTKQAKKEELLAYFDEGMNYGKKAAEVGNINGNFWAAANLGRWGETKGIFDSLGQAEPMRKFLITTLSKSPNHDDSLNLMALLYFGLCKQDTKIGNLKFGDINKAVSFDRKAIEVCDNTPDLNFLKDLGKHLLARGESAEKRIELKSIQKAGLDSLQNPNSWQKNEFYEGVCDFSKAYYWTNGTALKDLSDFQESKMLYTFIKNSIMDVKAKNGKLTKDYQRKLDYANEMLAKLAKKGV